MLKTDKCCTWRTKNKLFIIYTFLPSLLLFYLCFTDFLLFQNNTAFIYRRAQQELNNDWHRLSSICCYMKKGFLGEEKSLRRGLHGLSFFWVLRCRGDICRSHFLVHTLHVQIFISTISLVKTTLYSLNLCERWDSFVQCHSWKIVLFLCSL